jgi:hypothetical protein
MKPGDRVLVLKDRDTPAAIGNKVVAVVKVDELSIWVESKGQTYVLARPQVRRQK